MRISKQLNKHIFCLEGDWDEDLRIKSSITASLDFLQANCGIEYIHKSCGTKENLAYYLSLWKQKQYKHYTIGYFAFHGHPAEIQVGRERIGLEELGKMLKNSCANKIIHFGSCNTLNIDQEAIYKFLDITKALAVCGFQSKIDFLQSSVFDMLLLQKMQEFKDISALERNLKKDYRSLMKLLNFRLIYN